MDPEKLPEYISALVDKDASDLTAEEIEFLQHIMDDRPELLGTYKLDVATKLCLARHMQTVRCPRAIADSIRSAIHHMFKSRQASL